MSRVVTRKRIAQALAKNPSTITRRADKERWPFEEVSTNGGLQRHYPVDSLPKPVREALAELSAREAAQEALNRGAAEMAPAEVSGGNAAAHARRLAAEREEKQRAVQAAKQEGLKRFSALPSDSPKRLRAKARETVLMALWDYQRRRQLPLRPALKQFAELANAGEINLPESVWDWMPTYGGGRGLHVGSLKRWHYDYKDEGLWGLVDGHGTRKGQFKVLQVEGLAKVIHDMMLANPHTTPTQIKKYLEADHPDKNTVSVKAIERYMKHWQEENAQYFMYETNPDAWKNNYMAAVGSQHEDVKRLNQRWELDSTPGDLMLKDGRHSVIAVIDMYTRRLKPLVSKTSTATAVCQVFRRALLDWGVPEAIVTDNGADYVSHQFKSVVRSLDIDQRLCLPFASEQKGTIERALKTMSHSIVEMLPGYIGHSVADRKVIEGRKSFAQRIMSKDEVVEVSLTSEEFQKLLDDWADYAYGRDPHSGLDGRSPFEVAAAWKEPVNKIHDERALDLLLEEIGGWRTITKKGIRFENHQYDAPELFEHVGKQAELKRDEQDIGRLTAYVDGEFVAVVECAELLGISRKDRARAAQQFQKEFLKSQREDFGQFRKSVNKNIGAVVMDARRKEAENVSMMPHAGVSYTTDGLEQAGKAARARRTGAPQVDAQQQMTPEQKAKFKAQFEAEKNKPKAPVTAIESNRDKYERWVRLDRQIAAGHVPSDAEARFHKHFPQSSAYKSQKTFYADFNLQVKDA
ncbi:hypothetical protein E4656_13615 [Natronospirillum operosum]|uniref:Integrase catalytic domain-containing protein n=1 Tax=Natronospirillum operosum TaxID=2759953 RepID=A0A4Z0WD39_9GAMM|nr:DDE-type integrase/transposase/recombinase [Natronospirillum operosum]TGG92504.1 hypothetical protein E4656_13615 [Natronospirillum operosum]